MHVTTKGEHSILRSVLECGCRKKILNVDGFEQMELRRLVGCVFTVVSERRNWKRGGGGKGITCYCNDKEE